MKRNELTDYLNALCKWEALELNITDLGDELLIRIPYVMNDAVECYLEFTGCRMQGEWVEQEDCDPWESRGEFSFELVEPENMERTDSRKGIILRQPDGNTITIWYKEAHIHKNCYQYHRIGHQWRKTAGQEELRRIVNLLCVLHDKVSYLDESCYTLEEKQLAELIEFAPLCYWTPINESIEDWYPQTIDGIARIKEIAEETKDIKYLKFIENYENALPKKQAKWKIQLAQALDQPEHQEIFQKIREKIEEASLHWGERRYHADLQENVDELRRCETMKLRAQGYQGTYPIFCKKKEKSGQPDLVHEIRLIEEQPFTVMEADNYSFRIFPHSAMRKTES